MTLEVGAIEESITVTGQSPLIDTSTASTGGVLDRQALETLPAPGRNAFLIGITVPTVMPAGDPQFNRQQDQTNASPRVARRRRPPRQQLPRSTAFRSRSCAAAPSLNPTMEALEEVKVQVHTYDAEMGRTGGGVFNVTATFGHQQLPRQRLLPDASGVGPVAELLQRGRGPDEGRDRSVGCVLPVVRRRRRRADHQGPDVLLGGARRLPVGHDAKPAGDLADGSISATATSRTRRAAARRSCSTTRGAAAVCANARCPATGTGSIATGGLFTGGIIPLTHPAVSQTGLNILEQLADSDDPGSRWRTNEDGNPNASGTSFVVDKAMMYTFKAEHKFSDKSSLSGSTSTTRPTSRAARS